MSGVGCKSGLLSEGIRMTRETSHDYSTPEPVEQARHHAEHTTILLSGGIDSAALLPFYLATGRPVHTLHI